SVEKKRLQANCSVDVAGSVQGEGTSTDGSVIVRDVVNERFKPYGSVEVGASITTTGVLTNGNVVAPSCVVPQRAYANRCVLRPSCAANHRTFTHRCVAIAGGVTCQGPIAERIVVGTSGVAKKRFK